MQMPVQSGAVVLLACLGVLPLASCLRRRAKVGVARPAPIRLALMASALLPASGLAMALH
jgi:hypothetical protein